VLEKHGPRPYGNPWSDILKLKTLNVLTSRARKRASETNKINFQCDVFDGDNEIQCHHGFPQLLRFPDPFEACSIKERIENEIGLIKNGLKEEQMSAAIPLKECQIGKEYYTFHGKKIQLVELSGNRAKMLLLLSDTTIPVSSSYKVFKTIEDFREHHEEENAASEEKQPKKAKTSSSGKVKVRAKDVLSKKDEADKKKDKKAKPKDKVKQPKKDKKSNKKEGGSGTMKKNTAKQLVLSLLRKGPHTRDDLAKAVIAKGLTENTEIKKVKHYISVMLSNIKRKDGIKIITLEPGKYAIEE
jgi:hypothetical protein